MPLVQLLFVRNTRNMYYFFHLCRDQFQIKLIIFFSKKYYLSPCSQKEIAKPCFLLLKDAQFVANF